jgi:hypothetical protein
MRPKRAAHKTANDDGSGEISPDDECLGPLSSASRPMSPEALAGAAIERRLSAVFNVQDRGWIDEAPPLLTKPQEAEWEAIQAMDTGVFSISFVQLAIVKQHCRRFWLLDLDAPAGEFCWQFEFALFLVHFNTHAHTRTRVMVPLALSHFVAVTFLQFQAHSVGCSHSVYGASLA